MAILFVPENQYWKINFDKCYVNNCVFINLTIYKDEANRVKEKERQNLLTSFKISIINEIKQNFDNLDKYIEEKGYITEIPIDDTYYWQAANFASRLENTVNQIFKRLYIVGDAKKLPKMTISNDIKEVLDKYNFSRTWINDPISITLELTLNCGDYNGEELTQEFYYQKLKEMIDKEIIDLL